MSDPHDPRGGDGLLHLNHKVHQPAAPNHQATTLPAPTRLRIMPTRADAQASAKVALLVDDGERADAVAELIAELGWSVELIRLAELDTSTASYWDLIIIVTNMGATQILQICARASRDVRQRIMVISRHRDPQLIADVLNAGADDYLIAPFDADECRARMNALVHRSGVQSRSHSQHMLWVEPLTRTIGVGSTHTSLSSREWHLLMILIEAQQQPVSAAQLEARIWGTIGHQSTLASIISRLRHRLRANQLYGIDVVTIRNTGYAVRYDSLNSSLLEAIADESAYE